MSFSRLTSCFALLLIAGTAFAMPPEASKPESDPSVEHGTQGSEKTEAPTCAPIGRWMDPKTRKTLAQDTLLAELAAAPVVFLGEVHDQSEHHRWQLQMLAALHTRNPNMVLAFESFPREAQSALDQWTRGDLNAHEFLKKTDWQRVWGIATADYMPLFHFARMNRLPMLAINLDRSIIGRIREEGLENVPVEDRLGIEDPVAPPQGYVDYLAHVLEAHFEARSFKAPDDAMHAGKNDESRPEEPETEAQKEDETEDPLGPENKRRFVEAQTTWDRAMAEPIAKIRKAGGDPLVVVIVGRGHLQYDYGIPHQLNALGVTGSKVVLPWNADLSCDDLVADDDRPVARAVFGMKETVVSDPHAKQGNRMKLGVYIRDVEDGTGVRVTGVVPDSVAIATGIEAQDVIIEAAGQKVETTGDLIAIIQRMAPGTWLPIVFERDGNRREKIAKFPAPGQ